LVQIDFSYMTSYRLSNCQ